MVETLGALSGAFGSGHRHLPQAEATGGLSPESPSGNGRAEDNSSLLSAYAVLNRTEDVKEKLGCESYRHVFQAADAVISDSARSEAENNAEQISSEVMYKKGKLCAFFFCKMEGHLSDDALSWSDYILPSGALWSDEEGGWLKIFCCCCDEFVFISELQILANSVCCETRGRVHGCWRS